MKKRKLIQAILRINPSYKEGFLREENVKSLQEILMRLEKNEALKRSLCNLDAGIAQTTFELDQLFRRNF